MRQRLKLGARARRWHKASSHNGSALLRSDHPEAAGQAWPLPHTCLAGSRQRLAAAQHPMRSVAWQLPTAAASATGPRLRAARGCARCRQRLAMVLGSGLLEASCRQRLARDGSCRVAPAQSAAGGNVARSASRAHAGAPRRAHAASRQPLARSDHACSPATGPLASSPPTALPRQRLSACGLGASWRASMCPALRACHASARHRLSGNNVAAAVSGQPLAAACLEQAAAPCDCQPLAAAVAAACSSQPRARC